MDRLQPTRIAGVVVLAALGLSACGGGGGGGGGGGTTPPPSGNVTVSGTVTFDRPTYNSNNTLNFVTTERLPVRGATVEILRASDRSVLASTTTDGTTGNYSASIASNTFIVRVKAQLLKSGTGGYDLEVRNNTSGNALYTLDSSTVTPSGSSARVDLNAPTGWVNGSYVNTRAAAPFAILYMLWEAKLKLQAAEPGLLLPAIDVYWSTQNTGTDCDQGQPDPTTGQLGSTFYVGATIPASAICAATPPGIYVLGDASSDSDEFDASVIAHEFGHYYEDALSRSDSLGGPHYLNTRHDLRLAFSEGWGNAFQSMVLDSPWYRDTFTHVQVGDSSFAFNIETNTSPYTAVVTNGWFAEASVQEFLWDAYDGIGESVGGQVTDAIDLGYPAIHVVMRNEMANTEAMTSIYVMASGLEDRNPALQAAIRARLQAEGIFGQGEFGLNEAAVGASSGWPADQDAVPVYWPVSFGVRTSVVSTDLFADVGEDFYVAYNRLGGRRYLRIDLPEPGGGLRITAEGPTVDSDPDFYLYRAGVDQCPNGGACSGYDDSVGTGVEEATFVGLAAGTYVLEVSECSNLGQICSLASPLGPTSIDVVVTRQ